MEETINTLYKRIEEYAASHQLDSVLMALPDICNILSSKTKSTAVQTRYQSEIIHCMQVCQMLIDLHPVLSRKEEDVLLSAALLHVYPENITIEDLEEMIVDFLGFPREVYELLDILVPEENKADDDMSWYYERVQNNKLALLIILADRGNIVQQLYKYSTWNAHRYIEETKSCYYSMCIYGKEHYHDLLSPLSVLMEIIRTLVEVSEILLRRYEVREEELNRDILALREENATIRGIIAKFRSGEAANGNIG